MSRGTDRLFKNVKQFADTQYKHFTTRYGQLLIDIFEFPVRVVLSPFTIGFGIAGSAPRGFGVPELISKLSYLSVFAVATIGTYDIALELGKKVICQRCLPLLHVSLFDSSPSGTYYDKGGEKEIVECVAKAITENRAELVHLPSTMNLNLPLPTKDCQTCDGNGVMGCPECKDKLQVRISTDDIMEPPWKAYNVLKKMDYPYEVSMTFLLPEGLSI